MDVTSILRLFIWLAVLGGAVLLAMKLVGTAGSKVAGAL